jgi:hypothetical protein
MPKTRGDASSIFEEHLAGTNGDLDVAGQR